MMVHGCAVPEKRLNRQRSANHMRCSAGTTRPRAEALAYSTWRGASIPAYSCIKGSCRRQRCRAILSCTASSLIHTPRLQAVLDRIDDLNSQDSRMTQVDGKAVPYELAYSRWLTDWALKLTADNNPPPSEELIIVARGQHVQRWVIPRSSYPEVISYFQGLDPALVFNPVGRTAYLKWREDLKKFHAKTVTGIMAECEYDAQSCSKVESMILKKNLKDPESQTVEDALCLVFLQYQLSEFRAKEVDEKTVDIIRKTWKKMGEKGKAAALALAPSLPAADLKLVQAALA